MAAILAKGLPHRGLEPPRSLVTHGVDAVAAVRYKEAFLAAEYHRKEPLRELQ
jgi:hypothetical protein